MGHTSSRTHLPGHICHCPCQQPDYTFPDHWLQVVALDALYLMVPLFERHFCFPSVASPLKLFFLGVPICTPVARVLMRCPMSSSVWGGPACLWAFPTRSPSLPPGRGTSPAMTLGLATCQDPLPGPWAAPLGCHNLPSSCLQVDLRQHLSHLGVVKCKRAKWNWGWDPPSLGRGGGSKSSYGVGAGVPEGCLSHTVM